MRNLRGTAQSFRGAMRRSLPDIGPPQILRRLREGGFAENGTRPGRSQYLSWLCMLCKKRFRRRRASTYSRYRLNAQLEQVNERIDFCGIPFAGRNYDFPEAG